MALLKEVSTKDWATKEFNPTHEEIRTGCLQRIADATELMAKNHAALVDERDRYLRWYEQKRQQTASLGHVISGLRGRITRLKRQLDETTKGEKP